ncbi:MAG TPA: (d)CMP kinase [Mycobacteriales bacterium]|nr:(d)CMP kinase [Mycobacteriales bacterium]
MPVPLSGVIALDGPSGTGKSSVARALARRLGARYLDTGAMYRAATLAALRKGITPDDEPGVLATLAMTTIAVSTDPDDQQVTIDGVRVGAEIRTPQVTAQVSAVSAIAALRARLVAAQQALVGDGGIVVEGRDIGTVVAPDAGLKVYLTAASHERALRRSRQQGGTSPADVAETAVAIDRRDAFDSGRLASPLRPAPDAVHLDTTTLSLDQVVDRLVELASARGMLRAPDTASPR